MQQEQAPSQPTFALRVISPSSNYKHSLAAPTGLASSSEPRTLCLFPVQDGTNFYLVGYGPSDGPSKATGMTHYLVLLFTYSLSVEPTSTSMASSARSKSSWEVGRQAMSPRPRPLASKEARYARICNNCPIWIPASILLPLSFTRSLSLDLSFPKSISSSAR